MGFNTRRRIWFVAVFFIFIFWGEQYASDYRGSELSDFIWTIISTYITAMLLNKFFIKQWVFRGIHTEEDYNKAIKYEWVRNEIAKRSGETV